MEEEEKDKEKDKAEVIEHCDACGIPMTVDGTTVTGMSIRVEGDHSEIRRLKNHFGKTEFKICCVCWIKSLGVKEVGIYA